jgi:hypothetical protein
MPNSSGSRRRAVRNRAALYLFQRLVRGGAVSGNRARACGVRGLAMQSFQTPLSRVVTASYRLIATLQTRTSDHENFSAGITEARPNRRSNPSQPRLGSKRDAPSGAALGNCS